MSTDQEAFEAWCPAEAEDIRFFQKKAWRAALEWARSQQHPAGVVMDTGPIWYAAKIPDDYVGPLYTHPAPIPEGWQPIGTAPKGAKGYTWMMLAWGPEDAPSVGLGMRWGDRFFAAATFYCLGQEKQYELREIEVRPTHWMPISDAPQPEK